MARSRELNIEWELVRCASHVYTTAPGQRDVLRRVDVGDAGES